MFLERLHCCFPIGNMGARKALGIRIFSLADSRQFATALRGQLPSLILSLSKDELVEG